MTYNLEKGARFNLSKEAPGLTKVIVGLGWTPNNTDTGAPFDLDGTVFALGADGKIVDKHHFIYFNNLATPNQSIVHSGDVRGGEKLGDDETIAIDLEKLDPRITEISIIVTIHEAEARKHNFGQIPQAEINLYDANSKAKLATYDLDEDFSLETSVQFGSLYKKDGAWLFKAVGTGYKRGLADFVAAYTS